MRSEVEAMEQWLDSNGFKLRQYDGVPVWERNDGVMNVEVVRHKKQGCRHLWKCYYTDGDIDVCKNVNSPAEVDIFIKQVLAHQMAKR